MQGSQSKRLVCPLGKVYAHSFAFSSFKTFSQSKNLCLSAFTLSTICYQWECIGMAFLFLMSLSHALPSHRKKYTFGVLQHSLLAKCVLQYCLYFFPLILHHFVSTTRGNVASSVVWAPVLKGHGSPCIQRLCWRRITWLSPFFAIMKDFLFYGNGLCMSNIWFCIDSCVNVAEEIRTGLGLCKVFLIVRETGLPVKRAIST